MATIVKTTAEQALEALEVARQTYTRFGYNEETEERLVAILTAENKTQDQAQKRADQFRNLLWSIVAGGGVSASITHKVYAALGREDETDDRWI
jgi:hypothetical protein